MRIHLVRHGKPDFWATHQFGHWVTGREISVLWREYTESGILPDSVPSEKLLAHTRAIPKIYSSDLKRAIDSAQRLSADGRLHPLALFREADISHGFWPSLKLPLWTWSALTRAAWLIGYSRNCESSAEFHRRARQAAAKLVVEAEEHGEVMLVAHEWLNRAIFYHLQQKGWRADRRFQYHHWAWNSLFSLDIPPR